MQVQQRGNSWLEGTKKDQVLKTGIRHLSFVLLPAGNGVRFKLPREIRLLSHVLLFSSPFSMRQAKASELLKNGSLFEMQKQCQRETWLGWWSRQHRWRVYLGRWDSLHCQQASATKRSTVQVSKYCISAQCAPLFYTTTSDTNRSAAAAAASILCTLINTAESFSLGVHQLSVASESVLLTFVGLPYQECLSNIKAVWI
jgi:hypothetical protein